MLIYTFQTYPWLSQLKTEHPNLFVFKKLRAELPSLFNRISQENPQYIIGIAKPIHNYSQIETMAVNRFNQTKKVSPKGKDGYSLFIPPILPSGIVISPSPTDSFCNWTMYKIAEQLEKENLSAHLIFLHADIRGAKTLVANIAKYPGY